MKTLPEGMQAHLDSGATQLCWCWKLIRADGVAFGFTDHDEDVVFDDVRFAAATGFTAGEMKSGRDFSVDDVAAAGALSDDALNETDLAAGRYDGARVEVWRVCWAAPMMRVLIRAGTLGEVKRGRTGFEAELRGLKQALDAPVGRAFAYACDADVGDGACGIDLDAAAYRVEGVVCAVTDGRRFAADGLEDFTPGWFTGGKLVWLSGANLGDAIEVKRHGRTAASVAIEIWRAAAAAITIGDRFVVSVGCDKQFQTCKAKFANAINFRGFPYMPGNDAVIAYAKTDSDMDGGSRYGN